MKSDYISYAVMYWTLIAAGIAVTAQGIRIAWKHYYTLKPARSLWNSLHDPDRRGAYYAWWGLLGSVTIGLWHTYEIAFGNSFPAYWARMAEWALWAGMHQYLNYRIERVTDATMAG
jgi:hypothetical protein